MSSKCDINECMELYFELKRNKNNLTHLEMKIPNKLGLSKSKKIFDLIDKAVELLWKADFEMEHFMYKEYDSNFVTKEILDGTHNKRNLDKESYEGGVKIHD